MTKPVTYGEVKARSQEVNITQTLTPRGHAWPRDKLKTKYFFLQKTYGHDMLQGANVRSDEEVTCQFEIIIISSFLPGL